MNTLFLLEPADFTLLVSFFSLNVFVSLFLHARTHYAQGFVRAMQYFDNIIIAVATLLEPMIATLIAVAIGVGELPGPLGWAGNLLVILGTLGVVYPSMDKPMEH